MLIAETPRFKIYRFFAFNSLRNYSYVIGENASRKSVVIDPWDGEALRDWCRSEDWGIQAVLNTHRHHDHTRGNEAFANEIVGATPSWLKQLTSPGHTAEHVSYLLQDAGEVHLFVGDTLFQAGVGNCKNGGDPCTLFKTISHWVESLIDATCLHVGHDYLEKNLRFAQWIEPDNREVSLMLRQLDPQTTHFSAPHRWELEKEINPFLRLKSSSLRQHLFKLNPDLAKSPLSDEIVFVSLRKLRDQF